MLLDSAFARIEFAVQIASQIDPSMAPNPSLVAGARSAYLSAVDMFMDVICELTQESPEAQLLRRETARIMDEVERLDHLGPTIKIQRWFKTQHARMDALFKLERAAMAGSIVDRLLLVNESGDDVDNDDDSRGGGGQGSSTASTRTAYAANVVLVHWDYLRAKNLRMKDIIEELARRFKATCGGTTGHSRTGSDNSTTSTTSTTTSTGSDSAASTTTSCASASNNPRFAVLLKQQRVRANILRFVRRLGRPPFWARLQQQPGDARAFAAFVASLDSARDKLVARPAAAVRISSQGNASIAADVIAELVEADPTFRGVSFFGAAASTGSGRAGGGGGPGGGTGGISDKEEQEWTAIRGAGNGWAGAPPIANLSELSVWLAELPAARGGGGGGGELEEFEDWLADQLCFVFLVQFSLIKPWEYLVQRRGSKGRANLDRNIDLFNATVRWFSAGILGAAANVNGDSGGANPSSSCSSSSSSCSFLAATRLVRLVVRIGYRAAVHRRCLALGHAAHAALRPLLAGGSSRRLGAVWAKALQQDRRGADRARSRMTTRTTTTMQGEWEALEGIFGPGGTLHAVTSGGSGTATKLLLLTPSLSRSALGRPTLLSSSVPSSRSISSSSASSLLMRSASRSTSNSSRRSSLSLALSPRSPSSSSTTTTTTSSFVPALSVVLGALERRRQRSKFIRQPSQPQGWSTEADWKHMCGTYEVLQPLLATDLFRHGLLCCYEGFRPDKAALRSLRACLLVLPPKA